MKNTSENQSTRSKLPSFTYIVEEPKGENLKSIITLDQLGRIVIPEAIRVKNQIMDKQVLFIFFDKPSLVITLKEDGYKDCFKAERKIDSLGRIVLPVDMRRQLDIGTNDHLSIRITNNNEIVIEKLSATI